MNEQDRSDDCEDTAAGTPAGGEAPPQSAAPAHSAPSAKADGDAETDADAGDETAAGNPAAADSPGIADAADLPDEALRPVAPPLHEFDEESGDPVARQAEIRAEIERRAEELEELEIELADVDGELRALTDMGPRYQALTRVCDSLEELVEAGGGSLFWGHQDTDAKNVQRLLDARERIRVFEKDVERLQNRHRDIAAKVGKQNLVLEDLDYNLTEAVEAEEARNAEWLVERDPGDMPFRRQIMPWTRGFEEDSRFMRSFAATALLAMLLGSAIPFVDLPIPERSSTIEVPERVAKLVEQIREIPPAEAAPPEPEPEPEEPEQPEPDDFEEPEPVMAEEVVPELSEEPAEEAVVEAQPEPASAKEQVKSKGILAFRESFASRANAETTARLGSQARVSRAGEDAIGRPERSMVTTNAPGSSGGINLAEISRDVGGKAGGAIGGVEVTRVESDIGGNGTANRPMAGGGPSAGRTDEEIQIVFDRYKAALYRLYNRELRKDPTLRGQIVIKLTIEPDGSVSFCEVESSDMGAPLLAEQVVDRVSTFDFGAKEDILAVTILYPIDFLPAA